MGKWRWTGGLLALSSLLIVGCDSKRDESPTTFSTASLPDFNKPRQGQSYAVGERAEIPELAITVRAIKQCGGQYLKDGNQLLGIELSVQGRITNPVHFNPFHCKLHDSRRSSYTPTFKGCEPRLRDQRLSEGEQSRGWVSFELPKQAQGLTLVCTQAVPGATRRVEFRLEGHQP